MAFVETLAGARKNGSHSLLKSLSTRLALWKSRRDLAKLDDRQLADIGITPDAAQREAKLGLWDVPHTWHDR